MPWIPTPDRPLPMGDFCERLAALEAKLPGIAAGAVQPASPIVQSDFAFLCYYKCYYRAAVRNFAGAFAARPSLMDDFERRLAASCAAARAAAGEGEDAAKGDDGEGTRLRRQALSWLRAELAVYIKRWNVAKPQDRLAIRQALVGWRLHPALVGVRDTVALVNLPVAERAEWKNLWDEVATLMKDHTSTK